MKRFDVPRALNFTTDIVPVLSRFGCNSGSCHGKAIGQNGFKLSLYGFDPDYDYAAIAHEGHGRRVSPAAPDDSLLLRKPTALPHGGGVRFAADSEPYRLIRRWLEQGLPAEATKRRAMLSSKSFQASASFRAKASNNSVRWCIIPTAPLAM